MRVLVTGASGALGSRLVPALLADGHSVRALSRSAHRSDEVEWIQGDLRTGSGLPAVARGADVIVHAATDGGFTGGKMRLRKAFLHSAKTDVRGTDRLLEETKRSAAGAHVVYVSIVGIDRIPMSYYKHKLQAEEVVRISGLPFTIVRITQFHSLTDAVIRYSLRFPLALLPLRARYQPIDERDAAAGLTAIVRGKPGLRSVEIGGPEVRTMESLAAAWSELRRSNKRFRNLPMPGARLIEEGALCTQDRSGTITWEQWLKEMS